MAWPNWGVPIHSSLEVKQIGEAGDMPIFWDRHAAEADAVIPINRVKAHTAFRADHESGLCKIMTIGLGKKRGAATLHAHDASTAIPLAAQVILDKMPVMAGVAIVENGRHAPAQIAVLPGERIFREEPQLLRQAKALQPSIPFDALDLLIVQEMGKNISGTGMDTNIVGMWRRNGGPREPDFRVLAVLDLTPDSHGNASGVGLADLITERLRAKIDWHATYTNCLTAGNFAAAKQPVSLTSDREVVETGLMGKDAGNCPRRLDTEHAGTGITCGYRLRCWAKPTSRRRSRRSGRRGKSSSPPTVRWRAPVSELMAS